MQGVAPAAAEFGPLLLVDTAGCDMEEVREEDGTSTANPGEAEVCPRFGSIGRHPQNGSSGAFVMNGHRARGRPSGLERPAIATHLG